MLVELDRLGRHAMRAKLRHLLKKSWPFLCHASESWHPVLIEATLDASFRWHDRWFFYVDAFLA
jgi:hypothetical protein